MAAAAPLVSTAAGPFSSKHNHFHAENTAMEEDASSLTAAPAPRVVNDLLVRRVREGPYAPFFAYPATPRGKDDYVYHTVGDIDRYADAAACLYLQSGLFPQHPSTQKAEVVALLAPSSVDYVVSIFALSRLGFAVLYLSNRLATDAIVNLLQKTDCTKMIVSSHYASAAVEAATVATAANGDGKRPVSVFSLVDFEQYSAPPAAAGTPAVAADNRALIEAAWPTFATTPAATLASRIAFIIHSSGSTGLPKPIFQTHAACLANYESGIPYRAFITLPLFHNHGISTLFRALCAGKAAALYNANLPLAGSTLVASMRAVAPESLHCVPYALKLMAEDPRGIDTLRALKLVLYGGSSCPDELGDRLVAAGVYLAGHYGATEMGQLMTSFRDPETDKDWAYMRPVPLAKPFLSMVPLGASTDDTAGTETTYECVVLDGLPSKVVSNSDDPPNSFHTRDLFAKHPTRPDAWKYLGRIDDRVTLVNGEKVLPIPYEHQIRQHDLVRECVVFGVGRAVPGIMIIPSDKGALLASENNKALLNALMPVIEATNAQTEAFGRISREMVSILPTDTEYPRTDKGTVIRAAFYQRFAAEIDAVYQRFENSAGEDVDADSSKTLLTLNEAELETYLLDLFTKTLGVSADRLKADTDLFEAGVDSLQAITARAQVLREIDLGGRKPGHNVVFEFPSIRQLAQHFVALRSGGDADQESSYDANEIKAMEELIAKYSNFSAYTKVDASAKTHSAGPQTVLLTGATGSLGAHILNQLLQQNAQQVARVYCLVRASSPTAAEERIQATLVSKGLAPLPKDGRAVCLPADLSQASLGLDDAILADLRKSLTTVVHAAWAVNFNLGVRSFESHHIRGTRNLLDVALSSEGGRPAARLFFCSSISAAAGTPIPATIAEGYIHNLAHAQSMGYARSKVVTEHIIRAAAEQTGMTAQVLRLGQIIGDAQHGIWNTTEAIPLIFQSALTTGTLPALDETPSWMPVDAMARSVLELSGLTGDEAADAAVAAAASDVAIVYQVQNSRVFRWTEDLLPALRAAGLEFEIVPQREWVARLRASDPDPRKNPTIKLIDFYAEKYDNDRPGRAGLVFNTQKTEAVSAAMRSGFDVIGSGLVEKMVNWWKTQW